MVAGLEILNLHAQGGMAQVYRARGVGADGRTRDYALKKILPEFVAEPDAHRMFIEEARIASLLIHENIVRVYDLVQDEAGDFFIVMEFLDGSDLADVLAQYASARRSLPVWLSIHLAREVLSALHYATTEAIDREGTKLALIHRDLSPHNVFLCRSGHVKLMDFGVAKVAKRTIETQAGITKGKFGYMSPEQLQSDALDFRSDLYNVGILLYEMLTCRRLFDGEGLSQQLSAMIKGVVPSLEPSLAVPPELDALMRRALSKDREKRPASAHAFRVELGRIATRYSLVATADQVREELASVAPSGPAGDAPRERTAPHNLQSMLEDSTEIGEGPPSVRARSKKVVALRDPSVSREGPAPERKR